MSTAAVLVVAFAATALYRFLPLTGFSNDHHVYLAGAQQILHGYWPTRDWVDPGMPLMFGASAAAQLVIGRTQYAEALLVITAFGAASCAIVLAGRRLSGSVAAGALAALAALLIFPRTYAYPKILLYAVAPLTWAYYLRRPGTPGAAVIAGWVTIAGLFRHDHGAFLAIAGFLAVLLTPARGAGEMARRCAVYAGLVMLMAAPYAIYVAANGGIGRYIAMGLGFSAAEAERSRFVAPAFSMAGPAGANAEAWLYYLYRVLPIVAAVVMAARWIARGRPVDAPLVVALIATAALVNNSFLRDPLRVRIPDAIVPNVLLAVWLAGRAFPVRRPAPRAAAVALVIVLASGSALAIAVVGEAAEVINRGGLAQPAHWPEYVSRRTRELRDRFSDRQVPHGHVTPLVPFFRYLDRCAPPSSHLLVAGFAPELFVYARRPFAAGMTSFVDGYHQSAEAQQAMVARMKRQTVPFTLAYSDGLDDWQTAFPLVASYVRERFAPMTDIPTSSDRSLHVLVDTQLRPAGRDPETSWPCFQVTS